MAPDSFQLFQAKVTLIARLHQVIHLTEQVYEENWLVIEVFEAMHLLFIKVFHLVRRYNLIVVEIDDFEPVAYTAQCCLIFFAEHEPHEVLVIHLVFLFTFEFARHLIEYSVNCLTT